MIFKNLLSITKHAEIGGLVEKVKIDRSLKTATITCTEGVEIFVSGLESGKFLIVGRCQVVGMLHALPTSTTFVEEFELLEHVITLLSPDWACL